MFSSLVDGPVLSIEASLAADCDDGAISHSLLKSRSQPENHHIAAVLWINVHGRVLGMERSKKVSFKRYPI